MKSQNHSISVLWMTMLITGMGSLRTYQGQTSMALALTSSCLGFDVVG